MLKEPIAAKFPETAIITPDNGNLGPAASGRIYHEVRQRLGAVAVELNVKITEDVARLPAFASATAGADELALTLASGELAAQDRSFQDPILSEAAEQPRLVPIVDRESIADE